MKQFYHLLPPSVSSPAQFTTYWVCVKDMNKWFLSNDGDIKFAVGQFGRGEYNKQFYFDYDFEAWCAIIRYYLKHGESFPYMKNITDRFVPPAFHRELLAIYGEDNMWWVKKQ